MIKTSVSKSSPFFHLPLNSGLLLRKSETSLANSSALASTSPQAQDFPGLFHRGRFPVEVPGNDGGMGDQFGIALGQLALP